MNKIIRLNIVQHLFFWIFYLLIWSAHDLVYSRHFTTNVLSNTYTFIPYIFLVYFNLYSLMPLFLLKKKLVLYSLSIIFSILAITIISSWNHYFYFNNIIDYSPKAEFFIEAEGRISILTDILILVCFSMTLYLLREWYQKERSAREMKQKQLETELQLLKNQMNPHFLFNSLNSIYVMLGKNLTKGKDMLLQFSDILSHQLYETDKEYVLLSKEIQNLKNYINIEKIRHEDLAKVNVKFDDNVDGLKISPMLLLPIVENAFKHGQSSDGYWICIIMETLSSNILNFTVENSYIAKANDAIERNGIGLANIKRRLELIYPDNHQLQIERENAIFKVNLKLELNGYKVYNSR